MAKYLDKIVSAIPADRAEAFKAAVEGVDIDSLVKFGPDEFAAYIADETNKETARKEFDRYTSKGIEQGIKNGEEKIKKQMQDEVFPRWFEEKIAKEHPELKPDPLRKQVEETAKELAAEKAARAREKLELIAIRSAKIPEGFNPAWLVGEDEGKTNELIKNWNLAYDKDIARAKQEGAEETAKRYNLTITAGDQGGVVAQLQIEYRKALAEGRTQDALNLKSKLEEAKKDKK